MTKENTVALAGTSTAYRVLLGDSVTDELEQKLDKEEQKKFFALHLKYDKLAEKHPNSEPIKMINTDALPRFDSLLDYSRFLYRIDAKLSVMRDEPGPELHTLVSKMLKLIDKAVTETATAAVIDGKKTMLGRTLPSVPLSMRAVDALPYSYPNFDKTLSVVEDFWRDKNYSTRLNTELLRVVKASVENLSNRMKHTGATAKISDIAVAAQVYLMEHNWIKFGLEDVAEASYALAQAGYDHTVTVDGDILFASECKVAYRFLGANLESVLRRCVTSLASETLHGVVLAGRQPATDVVIACASLIVQRYARNWLLNMHYSFQDPSLSDKANLIGPMAIEKFAACNAPCAG